MGASNVAKVFIYLSKAGLTHRELVALLLMANISLDADEPPVYFGGRATIADAIGAEGDALAFEKDPDATPDQLRRAKSVDEQVRRVVKALVAAGAIVSAGDARSSKNAEYALCLDPGIIYKPVRRVRTDKGHSRMTWQRVKVADSPTEKEGQASTEKVGLNPPNEWGKLHRLGGNSPTEKEGPRSTDEPYEEYRDEPGNRLLDASLEGRTSNFDLADESQELSESEERNRQSAALQKLIAEEQRQTA